MDRKEVSLAGMNKEELAQYSSQISENDLFLKYINLPKDSQLVVYNNLNPYQQSMIWSQYEKQKQGTGNIFEGLEGEALEKKYFALSKDEQLKAYNSLDDKQKAHVWQIFEDQKKAKVGASGTTQAGQESDEKVRTVMGLTSAARKKVIDTFDDETLVEFYKKVELPNNKMTIWQEINDTQKDVIQKAAELHTKEQNLKKAQGNI